MPKKSVKQAAYWGSGFAEGELRSREAELVRTPVAEETPAQKRHSFKLARYWARENPYVSTVCRLRLAFCNHDLRFSRPLPPDIEAATRRYIREAWSEWLILDNVIGVWLPGGTPVVYPPEEVEYSDTFGMETLEVRLNLTTEQIEQLPISARHKQRLRMANSVKITADDPDFGFAVLKRERTGRGLASTPLRAVFLACLQQEALESGDAALAVACRGVYEQHKCGHEIRSGPLAGRPDHFLKRARAQAVMQEVKKRGVHHIFVTNFDHDILIGAGLPRPEAYSNLRYKAVAERLAWWALPFSAMLEMRILNPYLMQMIRVWCQEQRDRMRDHVVAVLQRAWDIQAEPIWGNTCFDDPRIMAEMIKLGLNAGPVSQETFLERMGLSADEERRRKAAEAELPDSLCLPRYDAAHGMVARGGRRPGVGDNTKI